MTPGEYVHWLASLNANINHFSPQKQLEEQVGVKISIYNQLHYVDVNKQILKCGIFLKDYRYSPHRWLKRW